MKAFLAARVPMPVWLLLTLLVLGTYYWAVDTFR
jgi:nitrogen fixation-related uncharacterized protein